MTDYMKKEGFLHEKLLVMPNQILDNNRMNPLMSHLYLTDIGYFPRAKYHYREREEGCDNHIFMLCVEGKGSIVMNNKVRHISENQYVIIPKGLAHSYYANDTEPWTIYWFHYNGDSASAYNGMLSDAEGYGTMNTLCLAWFIKQFGKIYTLLEAGYTENHMAVVSNLLRLMMTGIKLPMIWDDSAVANRNPMDTCIDYMLDHISDKLTLDHLSELLHLSRSHLIDRFKEHTGYTPMDYFIHLRIQRSCHLLDTTGLSINEIACKVGYEDPFYYSRTFKKVMGKSPRAYRKTEKG